MTNRPSWASGLTTRCRAHGTARASTKEPHDSAQPAREGGDRRRRKHRRRLPPASTALRPKTVDEHSPAWVRGLPRTGHDGVPARAAMAVRPIRSRRRRWLRVVDAALLVLALISYTTRRDTVPSRGMPPGLWSAVWLPLLNVRTGVVPTRVIRRLFAGYTAPACRTVEAVPHPKGRRPYVVLGTSPACGRVQTLIRFAQRDSRPVPSQCALRPVHVHDGGRHRQPLPPTGRVGMSTETPEPPVSPIAGCLSAPSRRTFVLTTAVGGAVEAGCLTTGPSLFGAAKVSPSGRLSLTSTASGTPSRSIDQDRARSGGSRVAALLRAGQTQVARAATPAARSVCRRPLRQLVPDADGSAGRRRCHRGRKPRRPFLALDGWLSS